jgi:hypothetical protein
MDIKKIETYRISFPGDVEYVDLSTDELQDLRKSIDKILPRKDRKSVVQDFRNFETNVVNLPSNVMLDQPDVNQAVFIFYSWCEKDEFINWVKRTYPEATITATEIMGIDQNDWLVLVVK